MTTTELKRTGMTGFATTIDTRPIVAELDTRADSTDNSLSFVATTAGVKRDGLDINIAGIRTENFMKNPVLLWAHDYMGDRLPIGKVTSIRAMKSKMKVRVEFDDQDDFAMQVKSKLDRGFLNTVSIGWETLDFDRETGTVVESDLLDVSVVPVPGDPDALVERQKVALRSLGQDLLDRFTDEESDTGGSGGLCTEGRCDQLADHEGAHMLDGLFTGGTVRPLRQVAPIDGWRVFETVGIPVSLTERSTDGTGGTGWFDTAGARWAEGEYAWYKISGDEPDQRSDGNAAQTTEEGEMERLERVVAALERITEAVGEARTAFTDLIDSAEADDTDQSMATLLAAFDDDQGEED